MVALNEDVIGGRPSHLIPRDVPFRFEAGTPAIEATIGFGAAIRWMRAIGMERHPRARPGHGPLPGRAAARGARACACWRPTCRPSKRIALATFVVDAPGMTQENVARALCDMFGVCVSGGYHCAHVLHARAHLDGTVRASPHVFNTTADIDPLVEGVRKPRNLK